MWFFVNRHPKEKSIYNQVSRLRLGWSSCLCLQVLRLQVCTTASGHFGAGELDDNATWSLLKHITLAFETGSLTEPGNCCFDSTGWLASPCDLLASACSPALELQAHITVPDSFVCFGGFELRSSLPFLWSPLSSPCYLSLISFSPW